jgi:hypothetical protein
MSVITLNSIRNLSKNERIQVSGSEIGFGFGLSLVKLSGKDLEVLS